MNYNIEYEREEDGRWIAEVPKYQAFSPMVQPPMTP